jgi:hypothetical protein
MAVVLTSHARTISAPAPGGAHDPRRWNPGPGFDPLMPLTSEHEVMLKFEVSDATALWGAAASQLARGGLCASDIDETIGSIDDPSIDDCLATLVVLRGTEGCDLIDFRVERASASAEMFAGLGHYVGGSHH